MLGATFPKTARTTGFARIVPLACFVAWALVGCGGDGKDLSRSGDDATACAVDEDRDGYGVGCPKGLDCNDENPDKHDGCSACELPAEGCECEPGTEPVECLSQELIDEDTLLCKAGTRYCRDGVWSECLGVVSFEAEVESHTGLGRVSQALVPTDPDTTSCSPCRPSCFPIEDPLDEVDGGLSGDNSRDATWAAGGGVTVGWTGGGDGPSVDTGSDCSLAVPADADCDGMPDEFDQLTGRDATFGTTGKTLYMDLAPGEQKSGRVALPTAVHGVDLYFLLDQTENQASLAPALAAAMDSGNWLDAPDSVTCLDTDFDGLPNDELKLGGIAGNVACLTRDVGLGAGWVREIPFEGPDTNGVRYGDFDESLFENEADVGSAVGDVRGALSAFQTNPNHGGPNGQVQALYALSTGQESYVGWDRPALPGRTCASGYGYPCFRDAALPAVVLFTGEPMFNGPPTASGDLGAGYPVNYPDAVHAGQLHAGSYPHYLPIPEGNDTFASAYDLSTAQMGVMTVGSLHDDLLTFTGDSSGLASDFDAAALRCTGMPDDRGADAVVRFDVAQDALLTVSTSGTRFPNVLAIRKEGTVAATDVAADGPVLPIGDDINVMEMLPALTTGIDMTVSGTSAGAQDGYPREFLGCYDGVVAESTDFGPDVVLSFSASDTMRVRFAATEGTFAESLSLFEAAPRLGAFDSGTDQIASGGDITVAQNMTGNAVRLIAGYAGAGATRHAQPLTTAGQPVLSTGTLFNDAGCATDAEDAPTVLFRVQVGPAARLRIETSGDAPGLAPDFDHVIGLYAGHGPPSALLACGQNNVTGINGQPLARGVVEELLDAPDGRYTVIVRGRGAADVGNFRLTMRDVAASPSPLGCHVHAEGLPSAFEADVVQGKTYYLVLRGLNAGDEGHYTLSLRDVNVGGDYDVCGQDGGGTSYTGDFSAGTYYAIIKGQAPGDGGLYQLTVGRPGLGQTTDYADLRSWTATRDALNGAGVRVLGVRTGVQPTLLEQMAALASATGAVSNTASPLVEEVNPASTTLSEDVGRAVVHAVQGLVAGTTMDVGLRLVATPDNPTPAFETTIEAVDLPGDGCDAPVNDVHIACVEGALPEFRVTIRNPPAPDSVPLNGADPHGGYWMTLELVGDGRFVIERIPVYVVPDDVTADPLPPGYAANASYWQDFDAHNCAPGERPDWSNLSWSATIPDGTSLRWSMCTAPDAAGLAGCSLETLAVVTASGSCSVNSDCPNGFCQAGVCQFPVGPSCLDDDECGHNGVCAGGTCRWTSLPIDPQALLKTRAGDPWMRLEMTLSSDAMRSVGPTVQRWRIEYDCIVSE